MDQVPTPTVVYIAGHGRSGSTILGMLLGKLPGAFLAGEIAGVFEHWADGHRCSCGQLVEECPLWSEVMLHFRAAVPDIEVHEATKVTNDVERLSAAIWPRGRKAAVLRTTYARIWKQMFASISAVSGASVIVDTSKTAHARANRPRALASTVGLPTKVVLLIRDPRAVMWSVHLAGFRKPVRKSYALEKTLFSWIVTNAFSVGLLTSSDLRAARLRYEELVDAPSSPLLRVGQALGLDITTPLALATSSGDIGAPHIFDGNAIRHDKSQILRPDPAVWRKAMPARAKLLALVAAPVARRYGYRLTES